MRRPPCPAADAAFDVFPTRRDTPYTDSGLQDAWRTARKKAGLEDVKGRSAILRTTELNAIHREGGDATAAAGHADKRTTYRHYISEPN